MRPRTGQKMPEKTSRIAMAGSFQRLAAHAVPAISASRNQSRA
jgi:hypothetical protein